MNDSNEIWPNAIWQRRDYSRVPFALYHDPEIYRLEQERIFRGATWSVLGLEVEIPKPGDYRICYVGDVPVVFNRDAEGRINAFVNRCAHRGAEIAREPFGNVTDFTCIYHNWCYSHGGDLIGVPFARGVNGRGGMPDDFDMARHGLRTLRVETWKGIIFGTFGDTTEPLESYLGPMVETLSRFLAESRAHGVRNVDSRVAALFVLSSASAQFTHGALAEKLGLGSASQGRYTKAIVDLVIGGLMASDPDPDSGGNL